MGARSIKLPPHLSCLSLRTSLSQPSSPGGSTRRAGCLKWSLPLRGCRACPHRTPGRGCWDQGWDWRGKTSEAVVSSGGEPEPPPGESSSLGGAAGASTAPGPAAAPGTRWLPGNRRRPPGTHSPALRFCPSASCYTETQASKIFS